MEETIHINSVCVSFESFRFGPGKDMEGSEQDNISIIQNCTELLLNIGYGVFAPVNQPSLRLDEIVILMVVFLLWISVVSLFIHRLVQNTYWTDKLNSKLSGGEKFATYNQDFSTLNIPRETMT